jgi:predicted acetyltransferase
MSCTLHFTGLGENAPCVPSREGFRLPRSKPSSTVGIVPELITPTARLAASFTAAVREFIADGRGGPDDRTLFGEMLQYAGPMGEPGPWMARVLEFERRLETHPPASFVPSTTLWWTDGDTYLGRINIRHRLNEHLREVGGHIGYDIRPSARRRGHATAMLAAALLRAAGLGIEKALITCDVDNIGSRKVIERNGGALEDQRGRKLRYWTPTALGGAAR